ncbi:MAG: PAS domain-containing sensor histidine kinase [Minisyncoccia bacterium]
MAAKAKIDGLTVFYESLFNNTLDGVAYGQMIFNAQGKPIDYIYVKVNKNFELLTGLKNAEGRRVTEVLPGIEISNPDWIPAHGRVALTGKPERFETYVKQASGWFLISLSSPQKNFFVSVFQNITEQKRAEQELKNAKLAAQNVLEDLSVEESRYESLAKELEKFKLAVDNTSDQIVIADPEGTTIYINKSTERVTGYATDEAMNKKVGTLWHLPMPREFYRNFWKTIKTDKKTFIGELQNRRKNGEVYDAEIKVSPVLDKNENVLYFVGVERDITEEKRLIKTKNEALAKDDAILASIGDGLVVTDKKGNITFINRAFELLTGWERAEVIGKLFTDIIPRKDERGNLIPFEKRILEEVVQGRAAIIPTAPIVNRQAIILPPSYFIRKDGTKFPVTGVASPINIDGEIIGAVEVFRDITQEKAINKAKDEFVSLASHQLRTPPSIISWYTETLKSGDLGQVNEKQAEYLDEIYKANQRMIAVINSLLNISRIEMGTFAVSVKEVDIKEIVDETIKELSSRFGRKIDLKETYAPDFGSFKADPNIMQIIIDNLLSNCFKYCSPQNTKIEISTKIENDSLVLSIKDNGIGIPQKDQSRIFEKLFRADNAVVENPDGTGLGLYMIKKIIVDGLGGNVWFESKENEGSTFYVSLPASGMQEKAGATKLAPIMPIY